MKKLKLLLVITKSEIGGAQVFVLNLALSLKNLGYDVEVAAGSGNYLFEELKKNNIKHHYLNSLKRDFNIFQSLYFIYDFYRLLKKNKYNIVHLNSSNTLVGTLSLYFLKPRPKIVFTFHGLSFLDRNYEMNSVFRFFSKLYFKIFAHLIDISVFVSKINYKESVDGSIVKSGKVIYNGLNKNKLSFFDAMQSRIYFSEKFNCDFTNDFIVGSTGRLAYQKNYDFLIDNFKILSKKIHGIKIIIIGDGPYHEKYKKRIEELGIKKHIYLAGAIKESYKYIKAFDVFTLPSHYEGLSISLIEAVFAEIPILASNVGGNIENVGGDIRQVFELNNIDDYINKLIEIIKNKSLFVEHNIKLKKNFALEKMVQEYVNLYESVIK